jgi:hypothetical protein
MSERTGLLLILKPIRKKQANLHETGPKLVPDSLGILDKTSCYYNTLETGANPFSGDKTI